MYEQLDTILSRRAMPEAPYGLEERIIAASLRTQTRRSNQWSVADFWQGFSDMFALPQPAFALVIALLVGTTMGLNGQAQAFFEDGGDQMAASFALADDNIDNGDSQ